MLSKLDHSKLQTIAAWLARLFLAGLFVTGGMQKIVQVSVGGAQRADSIGGEGAMFFGAMSEMEVYWTFIGLCEIGVSIMLLVPPLATLGALAMLAITLNTWMVTFDLLPVFKNTLIMNSVALLAVLFLLFRDRNRIMALVGPLWRPDSVSFFREAGSEDSADDSSL